MSGEPDCSGGLPMDADPAIRVTMMPKDTNYHGTIFGGVMLSYIDQAGAVEVGKLTRHPLVTVAMKEVIFKEPVFVGDLVSFFCRVERMGTTSVTVRVFVEAQRRTEALCRVPVTEAVVTYVAVDAERRPTSIVDTPEP